MENLNRTGNKLVKPDAYTYNTVINAWAKSGERGSASRAQHLLSIMEQRYNMGDHKIKPNTRSYTSVIDAWAKSGERGSALRAENLLNKMRMSFDAGNTDVQPNAHTYNAVINACAFSKHDDDYPEAIRIAFGVFEQFSGLPAMKPDAYTYASLLSVCANLLPRHDQQRRFACAKLLFERCRDGGHVNEFVLRKLRQTVTEREYIYFVGNPNASLSQLPKSWTKNSTNVRRHQNKRQQIK